MKDIIDKQSTLRRAIATATVVLTQSSAMEAVKNRSVPKGDVFEFSRAAGLLAIKKTSDVIPDCHPIPVEFASISFSTENLSIHISVEVHTIYKTGVEVEAMHGAAIVALTIYDMLKPLDKGIEISSIKLAQKSGGKTDFKKVSQRTLHCAVIVCSDSIKAGNAKDISGLAIMEKLMKMDIQGSQYEVISDDFAEIQEKAKFYSDQDFDIILFTGGTGVSPRDVTPDAIRPLINREIPGIMEAARKYGQDRTPYAMLSRGVAGFIKNSLVITLPGSVSGVNETMCAIFPYVLHLFSVKAGDKHNG